MYDSIICDSDDIKTFSTCILMSCERNMKSIHFVKLHFMRCILLLLEMQSYSYYYVALKSFQNLLKFFLLIDSHKFTNTENMLTYKKCARYIRTKKLSASFVFNNRSPLVFEKSHIKEKNSTTRVVRIKILPTIFNNFPLQNTKG